MKNKFCLGISLKTPLVNAQKISNLHQTKSKMAAAITLKFADTAISQLWLQFAHMFN